MKTKIDIEDMLREHDVTIEEVKSLPLFAHFTDEQAQEVIITIRHFAQIVYKNFQKDNKTL